MGITVDERWIDGRNLVPTPQEIFDFGYHLDRYDGPHLVWVGTPDGNVSFRGYQIPAPRLAFGMVNGFLPHYRWPIRQRCNVRGCCAPACLLLGDEPSSHPSANGRPGM